jgi:hemin uptake protein HemP
VKTRQPLQITYRSVRAPSVAPTRRLTTEALMAGAREVILEHRGEPYRLRVTSNGTLILTK